MLTVSGISAHEMQYQFRGETLYTAEQDIHFPQLTVGQTLKFAARARAPRQRFPGVDANTYAEHMKDMVMAVFGLRHTEHTKVGNDFVRGVSGGERKRVSIAEAWLGSCPLQCWDNSTRGLDSANALEFCRSLRLVTQLGGFTACLAIYQASQNAYELFDKCTVLYEGRQIYFGKMALAKSFFQNMGFQCPPRQTTADFLTSLTSPAERVVIPGFENRVPKTPDEFVATWKKSTEYAELIEEIKAYDHEFPFGSDSVTTFTASRRAQRSKYQRVKSPYTLSVWEQIRLCMTRGFHRLRGDTSIALSGFVGNFILALVIGSVFYNLREDTNSFFSRGALLFFAVLLNAFSSVLEVRSCLGCNNCVPFLIFADPHFVHATANCGKVCHSLIGSCG